MTRNHQLLASWSAVGFVIFFFIGFWLIARYVPPHSPQMTASAVAEVYGEYTAQIRAGMVLTMLGTGFAMIWTGLISVQLRRIEKENSVFTYAQIVSGTVGIIAVIFPLLIWSVASFRTDRDPEILLLLNDLAWVAFVMNVIGGITQVCVIGLAILSDKASTPVFPRWVGFYNLWTGLLFLPGALVPFFKTGPFAWDGIFSFWLPLVVFGGWFVVMFFSVRRSIQQLPS